MHLYVTVYANFLVSFSLTDVFVHNISNSFYQYKYITWHNRAWRRSSTPLLLYVWRVWRTASHWLRSVRLESQRQLSRETSLTCRPSGRSWRNCLATCLSSSQKLSFKWVLLCCFVSFAMKCNFSTLDPLKAAQISWLKRILISEILLRPGHNVLIKGHVLISRVSL